RCNGGYLELRGALTIRIMNINLAAAERYAFVGNVLRRGHRIFRRRSVEEDRNHPVPRLVSERISRRHRRHVPRRPDHHSHRLAHMIFDRCLESFLELTLALTAGEEQIAAGDIGGWVVEPEIPGDALQFRYCQLATA